MVRFWRAFLVVVAFAAGVAGPVKAGDEASFDGLLRRYVVAGADGVNRVDYGRWRATAADRAALEGYIAGQAGLSPSKLGRQEQFAYWANLYNAITLKVILDAYPVASIRDIKSAGVWLDPKAFTGPWVAKRVTVEGRALSLDEIEHSILRATFKDPRVHYSVNCASYGCPNIGLQAWRAETLEAELDAAARAFVNHPRGVAVGGDGALKVSSIYSWFKADFGGTDAALFAHFKRYAGPELAKALDAGAKVAGDDYDWSLNDVAKAKAGAKG
ncbi:MAG: DUF547 domain-containing protein [Hyphomicrobiaceae bacterium]